MLLLHIPPGKIRMDRFLNSGCELGEAMDPSIHPSTAAACAKLLDQIVVTTNGSEDGPLVITQNNLNLMFVSAVGVHAIFCCCYTGKCFAVMKVEFNFT